MTNDEYIQATRSLSETLRSYPARWDPLGPMFPFVIGLEIVGFVYHDGYAYEDPQSGGWRACSKEIEGNYPTFALAVTAMFEAWREKNGKDPEIGQVLRNRFDARVELDHPDGPRLVYGVNHDDRELFVPEGWRVDGLTHLHPVDGMYWVALVRK